MLGFNLFLGVVCALHFAPYSVAEKSYAKKLVCILLKIGEN